MSEASTTAAAAAAAAALYDKPPAAAPKDRLKLTYLLFSLQGFAVVLTFNVFVKNPLFQLVLASSSHATSFSATLTFAYMITMLLSSICLVFLPPRWKLSPPLFILVSIASSAVVLLFTALLSLYASSMPVDWFFAFIVVLAGLAGLFTGLFQNSLFGFASNFPPVYFQALNSGQGLSGLVTSAAMLVMRLTAANSIEKSSHITLVTVIYFFVSFVLLALSFFAFQCFLKSNALYKFYVVDAAERESIASSDSSKANSTSSNGISGHFRTIFGHVPSAYYPFAIMYVFIITFTIFPTFFVQTVSSTDPGDPALADYRELFGTISFLLFDLSDAIGKFLPGIPMLFIGSHSLSLLTSLLRTVFIPLFMCANFPFKLDDKDPFYPAAPRLIQSDIIFYIIVVAFGLSNGYYGTLLLMKAPTSVSVTSNGSIKETMGKIMSLFLGFGLAIGPLACYAMMAFLCRCNPLH